MKINYKLIALLLCVVLFTQCSQDKISQEAEEIGLKTQTEDNIQGRFAVDNIDITYSAKASSDLEYAIQLKINNSIIDASVDYENEGIVINGHDNNLSELEKDALLGTGKVFADYLLEQKNGDIAMIEYTLLTLMEYLAKSPEDYIYTKREIKTAVNTTNLRSRNEGIKCIRKNTYVNAQYDDSKGSHSDRVKVGSKARANYDCMGRCGGDCGRWWIPSAWTKDCLDHDQCSHINNASGGGRDRNCGDEFREAADDYIFGVIRGCRG